MQFSFKESEAYLNEHVLELRGTEAAFHIFYWGAHSSHYDNPVHRHSFFEVCYCLDGEGIYMDNYDEHPITGGTLFMSRPGIVHQIRSTSGLQLLFVAFEMDATSCNEDIIRGFDQLAHSAKIIMSDGYDLSSALIWKSLLMEISNPHSLRKEMISSLSYALIMSFHGAFSDQPEPNKPVISSSTSSTLIYRAKLFIRDNLSSALQLDDVAGYLHISERHLSRLFSKEVKLSFTDYIRQERIRAAVRLLQTTDLSIKHIAEATGFSSVHYFTRTFSHVMQIAPGRYRERVQRG